MKRYFVILLVMGLTVLPFRAQAQNDDVTGRWLTENHRAVIKIDHCNQGLCGRVDWIIKGGLQKDVKNPDEALRARPMCGLPILWGFRQQDPANWVDGHIYKADDGDTYHATLKLYYSGNQLLVHGYVGMPLFGISQTWTRVGEKDYPPCQ